MPIPYTLITSITCANLEFFFFLGTLFLLSISVFFSLTSFLGGCERLLDLWGWVGGEGLNARFFISSGLKVTSGIWLHWWVPGRRLFTSWSTAFHSLVWGVKDWIMLSSLASMMLSFATISASLIRSIRVKGDWLDSPKDKRHDSKVDAGLNFLFWILYIFLFWMKF